MVTITYSPGRSGIWACSRLPASEPLVSNWLTMRAASCTVPSTSAGRVSESASMGTSRSP